MDHQTHPVAPCPSGTWSPGPPAAFHASDAELGFQGRPSLRPQCRASIPSSAHNSLSWVPKTLNHPCLQAQPTTPPAPAKWRHHADATTVATYAFYSLHSNGCSHL